METPAIEHICEQLPGVAGVLHRRGHSDSAGVGGLPDANLVAGLAHRAGGCAGLLPLEEITAGRDLTFGRVLIWFS